MTQEQLNETAAQNLQPALTDDEKIDMAAARVLERFRAAFEELAK